MSDLIPGRVKVKTATTAQWETVKDNFIPMKGEVIVYSDGVNGKSAIKIGDGSRKVGLLPFLFVNAENVSYDDAMYGTNYEQDNVGDILSDIYFTKAEKNDLPLIVTYGETVDETEVCNAALSGRPIFLQKFSEDPVDPTNFTMDFVPLSTMDGELVGGVGSVSVFEFISAAAYSGGHPCYTYRGLGVWETIYLKHDADSISYSDAEHQSYTGCNNVGDAIEYLDHSLAGKANTSAIPTDTSDLNNDSGFITGADVPSNETDPTVSAWAKAANKPTYTASEVGALPDSTVVPDALAIASNVISLMAGATVLSTITLPVYNGGVS